MTTFFPIGIKWSEVAFIRWRLDKNHAMQEITRQPPKTIPSPQIDNMYNNKRIVLEAQKGWIKVRLEVLCVLHHFCLSKFINEVRGHTCGAGSLVRIELSL